MTRSPAEAARDEELVGLSAQIAEIEAQIQALVETVAPLRRRRTNILASMHSAEVRSRACHLRNLKIVDEAKALGSKLSHQWRDEIAVRHKLSTRQINRILRAADISIDAWR